MSYVQSGLNIGGSRMSAGGSAHPSGYPVQSAGGSAHPSGYPVKATTFGRGCPEIPNTQGESSHPRSDLSPRDVRIDIDQSMDGDNYEGIEMSPFRSGLSHLGSGGQSPSLNTYGRLSSRDVRIDIDQSMDGDNYEGIEMSPFRSGLPHLGIGRQSPSLNTYGRLSSSDVRIDIGDSTDGDNQNSFPMSLAIQFLAEKDPFELSRACRESHQNVDEALKERARQALSKNGALLERMSDRYKDDEELVLAAVEQYPEAYRHASDRLKKYPDIVAIVVKDHDFLLLEHQTRGDHDSPDEWLQNFRHAWQHIKEGETSLNGLPENFKDHRGILLEAIRVNGGIFGGVPEKFKRNSAFVLEAIRINSNAIHHMEDSLKQNTDIAVEIARHNIELLPQDHSVRKVLTGIEDKTLIDENGNLNVGKDLIMELSMNKSFMKLAVHLDQDCRFFKYVKNSGRNFEDPQILDLIKKNPGIFKFLTEKQKHDREFVLEAVRRNGQALQFALEIHKDDPQFVLEAVRRNGQALQFASETHQNNREIVLEAVRQNGQALQFASETHQNNLEIVLEAVRQNAEVYTNLNEPLQSDIQIVVIAGLQNSDLIRNINRDVFLQITAIRENGMDLENASAALKNCREFVLEAVRQNGMALRYASRDLQNDPEVVMAAVQQNEMALQHASRDLQNDRDFVLEAVRQNGDALQYASEALRGDPEVVMAAVQQNGMALEHASRNLQNDREVCRAAINTNRNAIFHVRDEYLRFRERPYYPNTAIFLRSLSTLINFYSVVRAMIINEERSAHGESPGINTDLQNLLLVLALLQLSTLAYTFYNQLNSLYTQDSERAERMFGNLGRISWQHPFLDFSSYIVNSIYSVMSTQESLDGSLDNRHGPNLPNLAEINTSIPILLVCLFCLHSRP
jgi:hypothetical protein